jgi:hypothetical protein
MRTNRFLAALAAAAIFTGCMRDPGGETPIDEGGSAAPKAKLNLRLTGVATHAATRSLEGKGVSTTGTNQIANAHVFILDAAGEGVVDYAPVTTAADLEALGGGGWMFPASIPTDSRVFVVANVHKDYNRTIRDLASLDQILSFTSDIWTQTDYNFATMTNREGPQSLTLTATGSARAEVRVAPVISRLELHELEAGGRIKSFTVSGVYITNFYPAYTYGGGFPAGATPIDNTRELASNGGMTGDEVNVMAQGTPLKAVMTGNRVWAYNVTAGSMPLLIVQLKNVTVGSTLREGPLYLTISSYGGTTAFAAGKIYRIPSLKFTEEHLTYVPSSEDAIDAEPIEWDAEDVDPEVAVPGTRILITPGSGNFSPFGASSTAPQSFGVSVGTGTLATWSVTITPGTYFEVINEDLAAGTFEIRPTGANTSVHERVETVRVTGTGDTGTTRASFSGSSEPFEVVQLAAAAGMEITGGLDLTDPADADSAPVDPAAISFDDEDTDADVRTITIRTNVAFKASVSPATDFVLEAVSPSLAKYGDGSVRLADSPEARGTYTFTVAARGANTSDGDLAATLTISCTDLGVADSPDDIAVALSQGSATAPIADIADPASQGNIIYFAGTEDDDPADSSTYDNNYLSLGTWGSEIDATNYLEKIAYFKWGSVIGFDNLSLHTAFNSDFATANNAVKFNPMPTSSSFSTYGNVPYSSGSNIETTNYTNTRAGKGDPCKLIGLTVAQLRGITNDSDLTALLDGRGDDYKNWAMPTSAQNITFVGTSTNTSHGTYTTASPTSPAWSATNPGYVTFLQGGNAILPAAGYRDTSGAVALQGTGGYYWSATPSSTLACSLYFNSTNVYPANASAIVRSGVPSVASAHNMLGLVPNISD